MLSKTYVKKSTGKILTEAWDLFRRPFFIMLHMSSFGFYNVFCNWNFKFLLCLVVFYFSVLKYSLVMLSRTTAVRMGI